VLTAQALARNSDIFKVVFPDDVHDSLLYKRWIYTFERTREFLQRYLGVVPRSTTDRQQ
jgi:hypothetical protein